jgi:hypothetical protein
MGKKPIGKGNRRSGSGSALPPSETTRGSEPLADVAVNSAGDEPSEAFANPPSEIVARDQPVIAPSDVAPDRTEDDKAAYSRLEANTDNAPLIETAANDSPAIAAEGGAPPLGGREQSIGAGVREPVETLLEAVDLSSLDDGIGITVPLLSEELEIEKRLITKDRIVVARTTLEREHWVEEMLEREDIEVERVPIGREIDTMPEILEDEAQIVVPVVEEILVTHRQLILKEEVRVRRLQDKIRHREVFTVREQEGLVARLAPETKAPPTAPMSLIEVFVGNGFEQLTQAHAIFRSTNAWLASAIDSDRRAMQALQVKFLEASALPFTAGLQVLRAFGGLSSGRAGPTSLDRR